MKVCAPAYINGGEYSLCGDAFDAPDTEDDVEPFRLAEVGQTVTCEICKQIIREVRDAYPRGYKRTQ